MQKKNVLIIEDNQEYQLFLRALIQLDNLVNSIQVVDSLEAARGALKKVRPDVILLDIGLDGENGFDFCTELKTTENLSDIPVIFLTAKEEIHDKVLGFSIGADDYIIKSADSLEIHARIKSVLKRQSRNLASSFLVRGGIQLDFSSQRVSLLDDSNEKPKELDLTPTEFKILSFLIRHESQIFTRQRLLDEIWNQNISITAGSRTVDTHIHSLRKKLGAKSAQIESVFGAGYRYNSPIPK